MEETRASRIYTQLMHFLLWLAIAVILFFPVAVTVACLGRDLFGFGSLSGGDFSFLSWLKLTLSASDAGGHNVLGETFLRGSVFLAAVVFLMLPGKWDRRLKWLGGGGLLFLLGALISAWCGVCVQDSLLEWANWLTIFCIFIICATMAHRGTSSEVLELGVHLYLLALAVMLPLSWLIMAAIADTPVMYGAFYNQNVFSAWILPAVPIVACRLWDCDSKRDTVFSVLYVVLMVMILSSLYYAYNRTAWALALFSLLLVCVAKRSSSWKERCWGTALSFIAVVCGVGGAVSYLRGYWWGMAAMVLLALGIILWLGVGAARRSVSGAWKRWLVVVCLSVVCCAAISQVCLIKDSHIAVRFQQLASGHDSSGLSRGEFYRVAWAIGCDKPWLGGGERCFKRLYGLYQRQALWYSSYVHCLTLELFASCGAINTLLALALVIYAGAGAARRCAQDLTAGQSWRCGACLGVLALFLHAQADVDSGFLSLCLLGAMLAGWAWGTPPTSNSLGLAAGAGASADEKQNAGGVASVDERQTADCGACVDEKQATGSIALVDEEVGPRRGIRKSLLVQYALAILVVMALGLNMQRTVSDFDFVSAKYWTDHDDIALANSIWLGVVEEDPYNSEALRFAVMGLLNNHDNMAPQDYTAILETLSQRAINSDPYRASVLVARALVLESSQRYPEALEMFRRALQLDSLNDPQRYVDTARVLLRMGKTSEAQECLEQAVKIFADCDFSQMFDFRADSVFNGMVEVYLRLIHLYEPRDPRHENCLEAIKKLLPDGKLYKYLQGETYWLTAEQEEQQKHWDAGRQLRDKAQQLFREVYAEDPNFMRVREHLRWTW